MTKLKVWKFFSVWMVLVLVVALGTVMFFTDFVKAQATSNHQTISHWFTLDEAAEEEAKVNP